MHQTKFSSPIDCTNAIHETPRKIRCEAKRLKAVGLNAHVLPIDVRSETSIADSVEWVRNTWGKLNVLVNNARIGMRTVNPRFMIEPQPFFQVTPEGFRNLFDTNLTGYFLVARGFTPLMLEQGRGKIVNITMNHETMRRTL